MENTETRLRRAAMQRDFRDVLIRDYRESLDAWHGRLADLHAANGFLPPETAVTFDTHYEALRSGVEEARLELASLERVRNDDGAWAAVAKRLEAAWQRVKETGARLAELVEGRA